VNIMNTAPRIVAPSSRHLSVADIDRSMAFYRDVLGFAVRRLDGGGGDPATAEAVSGAAHIQLGTQDDASDSRSTISVCSVSTINYVQHDLGVVDRDDVTILLIQRPPSHTGIGSCEAYVRDADALYAELVARVANVRGAPVSRAWGLRDFRVLDLEGNRITFAQPFE
jgi:catechol 2,3-dioxygenase-like lactoylglutathione lyase family enzyme